MKVQCIIEKFSDNNDICFNRKHMFESISKFDDFYEGDFEPNTTHILFIDYFPDKLYNMSDYIISKKKLGVKIIYAFYDEARFRVISSCIDDGLLDKIILFDSKYCNRFYGRVDTYISDYFVNENLFPIFNNNNSIDRCYFGHRFYERDLPINVTHLVDNTNYVNLYDKVQRFNGVMIFDTGISECGLKVIHHNKSKAVESLMSGVNAYCKSGINTINYNKYLLKFDGDISEISFKQEDIFKINRMVINQFIEEIRKVN